MGNRRKDSRDYRPATAFAGFGSSVIASCARRPLHHLSYPKGLTEARRAVREQVPVCPGVYGWLNRDRTLTYVGKSKSLRHRLTSYFAVETTDPKMARIRRESQTLVWEPISHELLALIREQELIDRWRPPFNVEGKPERRQPGFICVSRGTVPTLFFARQVPPRAAESFGPFAGRGRLGEAITSLNYVFQLRDCPDKVKMHFNNQLQLFGQDRTAQCLRHELNSCPGPCAGHCSRESYQHNVEKGLQFLRGRDHSILTRLEERMHRASGQRSFERACVLRDQLDQMKWLHRRIRQLSLSRRRLNGIWKLPGFDQQDHWMLLRSGQLIESLSDLQDPGTSRAIQNARNLASLIPRTNLDINVLLLLASWVRKHPDQLKSIHKFDEFPHLADQPAKSRRRSRSA